MDYNDYNNFIYSYVELHIYIPSTSVLHAEFRLDVIDTSQLFQQNFLSIISDSCIFVRKNTWIALYVDDIVIFTSNQQESDYIVKLIQSEFDIKDLGEAKLLLGLKLQRMPVGLFIHQMDYVVKLLKQSNMHDCKSVTTPCLPGDKFSKEQSPTTEEGKNAMRLVPYRETIGKLLFLAKSTRPDILFAITSLSRFNSNPGPIHWTGVKRILRYLKGTSDFGILISKQSDVQPQIFSDADWGNDVDTRKSVSGFCLMVGDTVVSYKSKLQKVVSLSTMKSELYALALSVQEAMWYVSFFKEIGNNQTITLLEDNQSCIQYLKNNNTTSRAKHVDIKFHFVNEALKNGDYCLKYCKSSDNIADIFTKPNSPAKLSSFLMMMSVGCRGRVGVQPTQ